MKLEEYPTPETDAARFDVEFDQYGSLRRVADENGDFVCESFARDLERRPRKANTVLMGIADGMELMNQNPRTTKRIRETLAETHKE